MYYTVYACFYQVMETRMEVWENKKCSRNMSQRQVFPQLFRVLPNYNVHANRSDQCFNNITCNQQQPWWYLNNDNMSSGKLFKNVSPVCDTADLHISTLHKLSRVFLYIPVNRQKHGQHVFYFFKKTLWQEKGKQPVNFDYQNANSLCSHYHYVISLCQFCVSIEL